MVILIVKTYLYTAAKVL